MGFKVVFLDDKKSCVLGTHVITISCALHYFANGIYLLPKDCPLTFNIFSYDGTDIVDYLSFCVSAFVF